MKASHDDDPSGPSWRTLTVAHVREPAGADSADVMFLESARIYRLSRAHPSFDRVIARLRKAAAEGRPVQVALAADHADLIEDCR